MTSPTRQEHYQDTADLKGQSSGVQTALLGVGAEVHQVSKAYHDLDRRLVAVETKSEAIEHEVGAIRSDVSEMRVDMREQSRMLHAIDANLDRHMIEESGEQRKILQWVITTLFGVLLALAGWAVDFFLKL